MASASAMINSTMIETNGIELEVFQAGEGGVPIVLCHGWPELAYSWRYQLQPLVDAGFHCIVPNQRGYGGSSKPTAVEAYDIHNLTDDQNGLLDALGIDRAIFVGHDWGAIMLWQHALLNPDRIIALANMSVPFKVRESSDPVIFWEKMLGTDFYLVHFNRYPDVAARSFESNVRRTLKNLYRTEHWLDDSPAQPDGYTIIKSAEIDNTRGRLLLQDHDLDVFVHAFEQGGFVAPCNWYRNFSRNWETTADVKQQIDIPCLMIYGEHDMVPKLDMSASISDLEIHTLNCGHWIQQEEPEQTNRILLDWLQRKALPLLS
ncbi:alpha/beta hydrolase [Porticoccaceae bacterium]|nr:alpha/beta hydrolase [Porticoccaceae bacterium]MDA8681701.1 alpha/beta hydrolase [Porticoccaceae bacterium]MDB2486600.1 alpha/beta hydrolase [Porticoccaceae bacterium]MDB2634993.1 alpha/beta hydrolase [Porticoccaceae bacterium]